MIFWPKSGLESMYRAEDSSVCVCASERERAYLFVYSVWVGVLEVNMGPKVLGAK